MNSVDVNYRLLVVDDEESIRFTFSEFLKGGGYQVDTADNLNVATALVADSDYDVVFLDILLGRDSGMNLLRVLSEQNPNCQVVMVTGSPEIATAAEAVRLHAFDYLVKPVTQEQLLRIAKLATERKQMIDAQEKFRLRMTAIFDGVREGILVFDEAGRLEDINSSGQEMLGCETALVGLTLDEIGQACPFAQIEWLLEIVRQRCLGEIYYLQFCNGRGETLTLSLCMSPLTNAAGQETGVVLVLRNEELPTKHLAD